MKKTLVKYAFPVTYCGLEIVSILQNLGTAFCGPCLDFYLVFGVSADYLILRGTKFLWILGTGSAYCLFLGLGIRKFIA